MSECFDAAKLSEALAIAFEGFGGSSGEKSAKATQDPDFPLQPREENARHEPGRGDPHMPPAKGIPGGTTAKVPSDLASQEAKRGHAHSEPCKEAHRQGCH